jgi:hypothetical protein
MKNSVGDITPRLKSKMLRRIKLPPSSVSKNKPSKKPSVKQVANRALLLRSSVDFQRTTRRYTSEDSLGYKQDRSCKVQCEGRMNPGPPFTYIFWAVMIPYRTRCDTPEFCRSSNGTDCFSPLSILRSNSQVSQALNPKGIESVKLKGTKMFLRAG